MPGRIRLAFNNPSSIPKDRKAVCGGEDRLSAQEVVEQRMRSLKLFHLASAPRLMLVWSMLLVVALVVMVACR